MQLVTSPHASTEMGRAITQTKALPLCQRPGHHMFISLFCLSMYRCISNIGECDQGLTVTAWLKLERSSDTEILGSGTFYHYESAYQVRLIDSNLLEVSIRVRRSDSTIANWLVSHRCPPSIMGRWMSMGFTFHPEGSLKLYINRQLTNVTTQNDRTDLNLRYEITEGFILGYDKRDFPKGNWSFVIDHLRIWTHEASHGEIIYYIFPYGTTPIYPISHTLTLQ